jgi:hypothetical protein
MVLALPACLENSTALHSECPYFISETSLNIGRSAPQGSSLNNVDARKKLNNNNTHNSTKHLLKPLNKLKL